jgi:RpiR family transcriptional regulator, carbohydrate utilization regulator
MATRLDNLLVLLRASHPELRPAERRVAEVVLQRADSVIYMTLADLAREARVSEPTVIRFSRSLGCEGFQEFKIRLAQSIAQSHAQSHAYTDLDITPEEGAEAYASKVFKATVETLAAVHRALDTRALEGAVAAIAGAGRLEFFGLGASGVVAADAYHKFFRLVNACACYTDAHMQLMSASALVPGDVVVAISHTGRTRELLETLPIAREAGATVVAITDPDSPVAAISSLVLNVRVREDTDTYTPMVSRIAHLLVIDTLAVGVARSGGQATAERLHRMKESLHVARPSKRGGL